MKLLALEHLVRTGPVDHADWNYKPVLGFIQRLRFRLALRLMGRRQFDSLLEIGYGSGVFMPALAERAKRVAGVDIHARHSEVAEVLARNGIEADLRCGSAAALPFPDDAFECVVAVSALEFVDDLDAACAEVRRVLRPGGEFFVITPGKSPLLDLGLWLLTRESAQNDFAGRRERVVPAVQAQFGEVAEIKWPGVGHRVVCLYRALRAVKTVRPRDSGKQATPAMGMARK